MVDVNLVFGEPPKPSGRNARAEWYAKRSEMQVHEHFTLHINGSRDETEQLTIDITGELARIPSLKRGRHPRFPGLYPDTEARLYGLTYLFDDIYENALPPTLNDELLIGVLILAPCNWGTDADNCATTIKDWLEPASKQIGGKNKRDRGWGVGVVPDDSSIRLFALHAKDARNAAAYSEPQHTRLILRRFHDSYKVINRFLLSFGL
ncbi:MAG: hypothetical protein GTN64_05620 [Candidatus Latescibacteria bacterium]|nr:hypothetical protein [Candidatus Latescibacterota bacterium]NIO78088.1 hypothetical protein [Candidatus Latescibacterota bacterium]